MPNVAHAEVADTPHQEPRSPQTAEAGAPLAGRYVSLDAYRGLIMVLLVSVGFGFGAV